MTRKKGSNISKKIERWNKKIQDKEKKIQDEEKNYTTKKIISAEEYKKVTSLRNKVSALQKERAQLLDTVAKQRSKARTNYLKI